MSRWVINRVGLVNFWYYQNQIFQLAHGRMLLRGTNGSGKSLTMQSLFPVLFDGDTSAYRLDSFGSRDRKMEDYLLGEKGVSDRDEGIGYLFLEVKREEREEYLTVGIGMHAHRGGKLNKWFFAIENNQRVGIDFELFEELRKDELTPLTKKKLKNRLEDIGRIFDTQKEYKHFVNERIFGFETMGQFDELIALLINLRSPKLSKEFRPSVIYGILQDSLPKLKDDELLPLSKTIEQLDGHRERLEDLSNELKELKRFSKVYQRWHGELVGQIAGKWVHFSKEKKQLESKNKKNLVRQQELEKKLAQEQTAFEKNETQVEALEQSIQELNQHEGMNLVSRGQELQEQLTEIQERLTKTENSLSKKQLQLSQQEAQLENHQQAKAGYVSDLEDLLIDNEQYRTYLRFEELDVVYGQKIRDKITKEEFDYWKKQVQNKKIHFQTVINQLLQLSELKRQLLVVEREVGEAQQKVDELERDLRQWQQTRQSEIEKWKQAFDQWRKTLPYTITDRVYSEVFYRMDHLLEEDIREEKVIEPLQIHYQEMLAKVQAQQVPLTVHYEELEKNQRKLEKEIEEWQQQKIPEPSRRESRMLNREKLQETNQFISFYQSVDFLEGVPQIEKDCIEGALFASGILDSLISEKGLSLSDDVQIIPQPKFFATTLADYLIVNPTIDQQLQPLIADVLQSIMVNEVDETLPTIFLDGSYQIANLKGQMPMEYQAAFIGATSQERFRQKKITELQVEITLIKEEKKVSQHLIEENQALQLQMKESYQKYPSGSDVYQAIAEWEKTRIEGRIQKEYLERKTQEATLMNQQVAKKKQEIHQITLQDGLNLEVTRYQEVLNYATNYEENLMDAYHCYQQVENKQETIASIKETIEIQQEEVEDFLHVQSELRGAESKQERLLQENLKQQKLIHVEELQIQLAQAKEEQKQRKDKRQQFSQVMKEFEKELVVTEVALANDQEAVKEVSYQEMHWQQLLAQEAQPLLESGISLFDFAQEEFREGSIKKVKDLEGNVITQFNFLADQLQSYQPQLINKSVIELTEEEEQRLGDFATYNNYKQPEFVVEGQRKTIFDLLDQLTQQKITLQDLSKKDDEELFKTIILESVGNILRVRIQQAMQWVEKMNQLLQQQKNTSGLSLSIQWKGIPSSSDQDLGTNQLVSLLQKPAEILSEADRIAISNHFQEKVRFAQEQVQENLEERNTLFQAIAKVLDYRDWFEFELKFKRTNEGYQAQVLTDRRFNQFSGGEKAIAMYLPLFTAVYSRYGDAGEFCPKIITLDEAFAGIDDANISELFKACEELGFNYVMNSQALFGDYPTVSRLMIYELLRPQNINLVTTIRYYWDGRKKHLVMEELNDERN